MRNRVIYLGTLLTSFSMLILLNLQICLAGEEDEETLKYKLGEVIVSASRIEEFVAETGSSVVVITEEEMRQKKYKTVLEAVQTELGVAAASNSAFGGSTSIFLRGGDSGHTLVMLDGIRLYDPIATNATYDLANLTLDNIERIEIIKGPQSSLYGSDAMGGVINIITKEGEGRPKYFASIERGSRDTYSYSSGVSGSINKFKYSLEGSLQDSDGISKARDGDEDDEYKNISTNAKFSYNLSEDLEIGLQGMFLKAKYDLDDGAYQDDPNNWLRYTNIVSNVFAEHRVNDIWDYQLRYSWVKNLRQYYDDEDNTDVGEYERSWFKGNTKEVDWQHNIDLGELFSFSEKMSDMLIAGFQYNYEAGREKSESATYGSSSLAKATSHNEGFYLENKFGFQGKLFNTLAIRADDHSRFGRHATGRATISYLFDCGTRLKTSYGKGFNAPSLYQLFSNYGDQNLNAEKSWGYDCGVEQKLFDKLLLSITYFHNRFQDLIEYDSNKPNTNSPWGTGMYVNRGSARTEGIETEMRYQPIDELTLSYSFNYTEAMDLERNQHLIRRPNNRHNININYRLFDNFNINFNLARNVKIYEEFVWGQLPTRLKDYTKADLALSYEPNDNFEVFVRIENLFDEVYQEANGYSVKPRFYHFGAKGKF